MPEAPEVAHLRKELVRLCKGRSLRSVDILRGRYKKHGPPNGFKEFTAALPLKLLNITQKGKVMFLHFEQDWCIISKLGLMGWWYEQGNPPEWMSAPHNLVFTFRGKTIIYTDVLSYGTLTFTNDANVVTKQLNMLAPDIGTVSYQEVLERVLSRPRLGKELIEDVMIDQKALFSGVGNYLKSEILYQARIAPMRTVASLTAAEWKIIVSCAKAVLRRMERSVSRTDIIKYEQSMQVYHKENDPKGNKVEKHKTKEGRTTFWVPSEQR